MLLDAPELREYFQPPSSTSCRTQGYPTVRPIPHSSTVPHAQDPPRQTRKPPVLTLLLSAFSLASATGKPIVLRHSSMWPAAWHMDLTAGSNRIMQPKARAIHAYFPRLLVISLRYGRRDCRCRPPPILDIPSPLLLLLRPRPSPLPSVPLAPQLQPRLPPAVFLQDSIGHPRII